MLTVVTWLWGDKYGADYVHKLASGLRRYLAQPYRFVVFVDRTKAGVKYGPGIDTRVITDDHLLTYKGCLVRLRMFDPAWQKKNAITDRFVCIDLDVVVVGQLDPLFDRLDPFVILQGVNSLNPCPYNGSLMMIRPNAYPEVWGDFSFEALRKVPFHDFPDDQGWLAHMIPTASGWGPADGVYAFGKVGWPKGEEIPPGARLVCFPGWRDPGAFSHLPWIQAHWRAEIPA